MRLQVYGRALDFAAHAAVLSSSWERKHSVVDHFSRAAESVVLNVAEGARLSSGPMKLTSLDYALGSSLECAACLDVARLKGLLLEPEGAREKHRLCEITKMLFGLRKAWEQAELREESRAYTAEESPTEPLFHHERLEVYQISLAFMRWFVSLAPAQELTIAFRPVDKMATSVILNIAEGNGRYSKLDHHRFLDVAQSSAVKAAAYLDLCVTKGLMVPIETAAGKDLLRRIGAMLARM
jgi:four helix bundle protein